MGAETNYRISGHESFPCRYAWLPKAVQGLSRDPRLFVDEEKAMVDLGLGKNMVRSVKFWAQVSGIAVPAPANGGGHLVTDFGRGLLDEDGLDPYLEDIRTLWLIHWNLSTTVKNPLLAWDFLLNRWQEPELAPSRARRALLKEATRSSENLSPVTIEQHLDAFLHTYVARRGRKGEVLEDNLDCPLVELELIVRVGEREADDSPGHREPVYIFRREEKPEITPEIFLYCLLDFWEKRHPNEMTLPLRDVAHGHGSPGQVFKLPEDDIRARVEGLSDQTNGLLAYRESANMQQVQKAGRDDLNRTLKQAYRKN